VTIAVLASAAAADLTDPRDVMFSACSSRLHPVCDAVTSPAAEFMSYGDILTQVSVIDERINGTAAQSRVSVRNIRAPPTVNRQSRSLISATDAMTIQQEADISAEIDQ
jgi:hypothetical protein